MVGPGVPTAGLRPEAVWKRAPSQPHTRTLLSSLSRLVSLVISSVSQLKHFRDDAQT